MTTKERKISELVPAEYNPRQLSDKQFEDLQASLSRFGAVDPAIVNIHPERKDIIVGGHQRLKVAKSLGWETYPCVEVNLTRDQERELNIRLNKNTGSWDWDILGNLFEQEELTEWGFTDEELFGNVEVEQVEAKEDDYQIPDEIETDIVLGDLIEIGEHRLLCGDSRQTDEWQKVFDGELADLIVTDPPYNVDYSSKNEALNYSDKGNRIQREIENDKMSDEFFYQFLYDFYVALGSYTKPGGAWYVWSPPGNTETTFRNSFSDSGLLLKQVIVWVKNTMVLGRQDYQWKHEPCLYGWKKGAAHYFTHERDKTTVIEDKVDIKKLTKAQMAEMLHKMLSDKIPTSVLRADKPYRSELHPTMKPVLLISQLIQNSSQPGELVADGFLGSGTTMVASHQLKRKCYGMELDPKYCQVVIDRMLKLDPSLNVKVNGQ